MSEDQLKAFIEAVKADAGLQEKLEAAVDADAVLAIAKAAGFEISAEELKRAQAVFSEEELAEQELEGVAGGKRELGRAGGRLEFPGLEWFSPSSIKTTNQTNTKKINTEPIP